MNNTTYVTMDFDCCGEQLSMPTSISELGSMLRHASAVDTCVMVLESIHSVNHPECIGE